MEQLYNGVGVSFPADLTQFRLGASFEALKTEELIEGMILITVFCFREASRCDLS